MKHLALVFLLSLSVILPATAQKFGYTNSAALLVDLPEVKEANSNLETLQKQLQKKGEQMVKELQLKYQEVAKKQQAGEISPKQLEEEEKKLKAEEANINQFEQDMVKQLSEKKEEYFGPILEKVNKAISDVAAENGYTYIFDSSTGILLFADNQFDVTPQVKTKLGI